MKKVLSFILSVSVILSMIPSVFAVEYGEELKNAPQKTYTQTFSDVPSDYWAFNYISEMVERNVLSGYPDGKFYPDEQVTRAEFAKIMTSAAGLPITQPTTKIFSDVNISEWYAPYVHTAKEYLSAYTQNGSSYYLPNTPALREDIAVALVKLKGYSTVGTDMTSITRMFNDSQSISENAKIYVATAVENGLISGYDDGTFKGQNGITRAEAATLLWRAYQYGNQNKNYDDVSNNDTAISDNISNNSTAIPDNSEYETNSAPYVMRTLVSANMKDLEMATMDNNNNIYYIDENDKAVYKVNVSEGTSSKYFETKGLSCEDIVWVSDTQDDDDEDSQKIEHNVKYSSFVPIQVYYNELTNSLLLVGYYENVVESFSSPKTGVYNAIYDITNPNSTEETVYYRLDDADSMYHAGLRKTSFIIQAPINKDYLYIKFDFAYVDGILNINTGEITPFEGVFNYYTRQNTLKHNNDLYIFVQKNHCLNKYSGGEITTIMEDIYCLRYGMKEKYFYFQQELSGGSYFYKVAVDTGEVTVLDMSEVDNTGHNYKETISYEYFGNWYYIKDKFLVIDDSTFVFYDGSLKQLVILEKQ